MDTLTQVKLILEAIEVTKARAEKALNAGGMKEFKDEMGNIVALEMTLVPTVQKLVRELEGK